VSCSLTSPATGHTSLNDAPAELRDTGDGPSTLVWMSDCFALALTCVLPNFAGNDFSVWKSVLIRFSDFTGCKR
jgi:hypothetical protein